MIRKITPDDDSALIDVAIASGLFTASQTDELAQMLAEYHMEPHRTRDVWLTFDDSDPIGIAYVAPERMTEGTWNLYLIAIHPDRQREGRGKELLDFIVDLLESQGERLLLVETSGTNDFDYVRRFYRNNDFSEEARIPDFYESGIDKIIYCKRLNESNR